MTGTVKSLLETFGFIKAEDGREFFFHDEDLVADDVELKVGDRVSFEVVEPQPARGPRARDVVWQTQS
jgi:cold shock CspA family protein